MKQQKKAPDLFRHAGESQSQREAPLAARMRPGSFAEFVGQEHIIGEGRVLRKSIETDQLPSIIFWGPPGSGKTTLANIVASVTKSHFSPISAVAAGVADLRRVVDEARERRGLYQQTTILFIDEIHRFNKAQQDAILPHVENGTVTLIGATTENPSFEVISPLLSRCRVFTLNALGDQELRGIIQQALADEERGLGKLNVELDTDALDLLLVMSNGDARVALNALELAASTSPPSRDGRRHIRLGDVEDALQHRALLYDKAGEEHYNIISALHKSLRDSDPDAGLYSGWAGCCRPARTPCTSPGGWSGSPPRTWAWPIPRRWSWLCQRNRPFTSSECPKGIWRSRRPRSISRPLPKATRCTKPAARCRETWRKPGWTRSRSICATP